MSRMSIDRLLADHEVAQLGAPVVDEVLEGPGANAGSDTDGDKSPVGGGRIGG